MFIGSMQRFLMPTAPCADMKYLYNNAMGKGAGVCGARGAMSLQAGEPVLVEQASVPKNPTVNQMRELEQAARHQDEILAFGKDALTFVARRNRLEKIAGLETIQNDLNTVLASENQTLKEALDQLVEQGYMREISYTPTILYAGISSQGDLVTHYDVTHEGNQRMEEMTELAKTIRGRQKASMMSGELGSVMKKLSQCSSYAQELLEYITHTEPHQPNQAYLAEQLGRTRTEISQAVKDLRQLGLLIHMAGGSGYYGPQHATHYKLSRLGFGAAVTIRDQTASSPNMSALMAE